MHACLSKDIEKSKHFKRLLQNQVNIAEVDLAEIVNGFNGCQIIEYLDLQCNDLGDKHAGLLVRSISGQFEMKDQLKWKLGLRNTKSFNITNLGLKHINLNRNILGTQAALTLSNALKSDEYLRALSLKKNKIGYEGLVGLIQAT